MENRESCKSVSVSENVPGAPSDPIMEVEEKLPLCLHNLEERRPSDRILKERETSHILIGRKNKSSVRILILWN